MLSFNNYAINKAELFEKLFGKKIPKTLYEYNLRLILDEHSIGKIPVFINPFTQDLEIPAKILLELLERVRIKNQEN